jgi:hypothetical protein
VWAGLEPQSSQSPPPEYLEFHFHFSEEYFLTVGAELSLSMLGQLSIVFLALWFC